MNFDLFKHFGVDMNNDTLSEVLDKLHEKGIGNACITPKGADDQPLGMFMLLSDTRAISYVKRALDTYEHDCRLADAPDEYEEDCEEIDTIRITHCYEDSPPVYLELGKDIDPIRAAVYCQFMCEKIFGLEATLTTFGVAALLVHFYGFQPAWSGRTSHCLTIEMYNEREDYCPPPQYEGLMNDLSLYRPVSKLREIMFPHIDGINKIGFDPIIARHKFYKQHGGSSC